MQPTQSDLIELLQRIQSNLESCVLGKSEEIQLMLTTMIAGGHVLLEDVPGTGKTALVKALAKSVNGQFRRIQCNPDLLPTDITGVSIYHPKEESFLFRPGPIMTHILLIDEINRATTKTQSALLEAMEEHHVTVDGDSHPLPTPFLLFATQNPIDFEGTYSLPEAQLDRFMIKLSLGYPDESTEKLMIGAHVGGQPIDRLHAVADIESVVLMQQTARDVHLDDSVAEYLIRITRNTREHPAIMLGASPRATIALVNAAKAYAFLQGRNFVIPDDVKRLTPYVLAHRLILHPESRMDGDTAETVLQSILSQVKVPVRVER